MASSDLVASFGKVVRLYIGDVAQRIAFLDDIFRWSAEWRLAPATLLDIMRTVYPDTISDSNKLALLVTRYEAGQRMPWEVQE